MIGKEKIVECKIEHGKYENTIFVKFEGDDEFQRLLSYYWDEISFTENEILGLTKDEAMKLYFDKDREYLRS